MFAHIFVGKYLQCSLCKLSDAILSRLYIRMVLSCMFYFYIQYLFHLHTLAYKHTYVDQIINDLYPYLICRVYSLLPPPNCTNLHKYGPYLTPPQCYPRKSNILLYKLH